MIEPSITIGFLVFIGLGWLYIFFDTSRSNRKREDDYYHQRPITRGETNHADD
jgi:hypothetical protein